MIKNMKFNFYRNLIRIINNQIFLKKPNFTSSTILSSSSLIIELPKKNFYSYQFKFISTHKYNRNNPKMNGTKESRSISEGERVAIIGSGNW